MTRKCKICGFTWDVSVKNQDSVYICPRCDDESVLTQIEVRYPTPSRKFRHNKKSRSACRLLEAAIVYQF